MGWLKKIKFIIWGSSTLLVSQDKEIQEWIKKLDKEGVKLYACKWCADQYEVSGLLKELGVDVRNNENLTISIAIRNRLY